MKKVKTLIVNTLFILLTVQTIHAEILVKNETVFKTQQNISQNLVDTTNKQQLLQKVREKGSIKVWVFYNMDYEPEGNLNGIQVLEQREAIQNMHSQFINDLEQQKLHVKSINKMNREPRIAMFVDEKALNYIFNSPKVKKIALVQRYRIHLNESTSIIKADDTWDLGFRGEEEVIVIIDTGVDPDHEMLNGKVIDGACFSTDDWVQDISSLCPNESNQDFGISAGVNCTGVEGCDHGTHVAGIAVGNTQNLKGVANGADIISIQVFSEIDDEDECPDIDDDGVGDAPCLEAFGDDIQSALEYVFDEFYQNQNYNIAAVNMSLGAGQFSSECSSHVLEQSISALFNAGISVAAASGNEGFTNAMAAPACIPDAISIGATDKQDDHWEDSNAAPFLDLVAPGVVFNSSMPVYNYAQFIGTSQAAQHVSGTIAIMREATPSLSPSQIRSVLRNSAYWESSMNPDWPYDPPSNEYGYGRLDTYESLIGALDLNPNVLLPDDNTTYANQVFEGKDIYVQDNFTLTLEGEVTLDKNQTLNDRPSSLNVVGNLAGPSNASLNLIDESVLKILSGGTNNFNGDINIIIQDELTFAEDTTIESGFNLVIESGGTLNLVNGVTFSTELGVEFAMEPNTQIASVASAPQQSTLMADGANSSSTSKNFSKKTISNYGDNSLPSEFSLMANYPNPFNPVTVIRYEVPITSQVELAVFDLLGRKVATLVDGQVSAGQQEVRFDASHLSSGIYIYRIRANDFVEIKQMTLIK